MSTMERACRAILKLKKENISAADLKANTRLIEDLEFDSIDLAELVVAAEAEFSLKIPLADAKTLTTIGAAVEYFDRRLAQQR